MHCYHSPICLIVMMFKIKQTGNKARNRGCPVRFAGPALREDDSLVNALLTTREEEPEGQRGLLERLWQLYVLQILKKNIP